MCVLTLNSYMPLLVNTCKHLKRKLLSRGMGGLGMSIFSEMLVTEFDNSKKLTNVLKNWLYNSRKYVIDDWRLNANLKSRNFKSWHGQKCTLSKRFDLRKWCFFLVVYQSWVAFKRIPKRYVCGILFTTDYSPNCKKSGFVTPRRNSVYNNTVCSITAQLIKEVPHDVQF